MSHYSVLITGSSTGFGRLTAETLARKGHTVFASMRGINGKNAQVAQELTDLAKSENLALHVVALDVTDTDSIQAAVKQVVDTAERIDVVVNNAGIGTFGVVESHNIEQAKSVYDVNVLGVLRVNQAVLPYMRQQKSGLLVHVSSMLGRVVMPALGLYTSTKWALEALAEVSRYELASLGIDSVIVQPGAFGTSFGANIISGNQDTLGAYPAVTQAAQEMMTHMQESTTGANAPDPQSVAAVITNLIETPTGQRPLRTLVGPDTAIAQPINDTASQVQGQMADMLGLKELITING